MADPQSVPYLQQFKLYSQKLKKTSSTRLGQSSSISSVSPSASFASRLRLHHPWLFLSSQFVFPTISFQAKIATFHLCTNLRHIASQITAPRKSKQRHLT